VVSKVHLKIIIKNTLLCNILNVFVLIFCHVTKVSEDDESGEEAGQRIHGRRDQTVSVVRKKLVMVTVNFRAIDNEQDRTLPVTNYL